LKEELKLNGINLSVGTTMDMMTSGAGSPEELSSGP